MIWFRCFIEREFRLYVHRASIIRVCAYRIVAHRIVGCVSWNVSLYSNFTFKFCRMRRPFQFVLENVYTLYLYERGVDADALSILKVICRCWRRHHNNGVVALMSCSQGWLLEEQIGHSNLFSTEIAAQQRFSWIFLFSRVFYCIELGRWLVDNKVQGLLPSDFATRAHLRCRHTTWYSYSFLSTRKENIEHTRDTRHQRQTHNMHYLNTYIQGKPKSTWSC